MRNNGAIEKENRKTLRTEASLSTMAPQFTSPVELRAYPALRAECFT